MNKKKQAIYDEEELEVGRMGSIFNKIINDDSISNKKRVSKINKLTQEVKDNRTLWMSTRHTLPKMMLARAKERR